jgi:hypothetical protein
MNVIDTDTKPRMPVEASSSVQVNLQKTPSPARPKSTFRGESLRTDHSKTSETWTGDAEFFPGSRSPSAIRAPQRTLQAHFQSMSVRKGDGPVCQGPSVQRWLETLDVASTIPAEIEEVDTPPLSPNVEIERGSMRRWRRKWEIDERNSKCNEGR